MKDSVKQELYGLGIDLIKELRKEFCTTAIPGGVEKLKRKLEEQERMNERLKAQLRNQLTLVKLLYKAAYAMAAWGSMEDGIPDMNVGTVGRPVNPYQVYLDISPHVCRSLHYQNCSFCSRLDCCDNTSEKKED